MITQDVDLCLIIIIQNNLPFVIKYLNKFTFAAQISSNQKENKLSIKAFKITIIIYNK